MVIHKSFADFVLFLYIHMAHADREFHEEEKEIILQRIPKILPHESDPHKKLENAIVEYESFDRSQITPLIRDTFKHFDHVKFAQKYKVYTDMYAIIHADGKVHELETKALKELKQIIDLGAQKD